MERHQLIEFFGVIPEVSEDEASENYRVERDYLILDVTFYLLSGLSVSLKQNDIEILSIDLDDGFEIKRFQKSNYDCLEFRIGSQDSYGEPDWRHFVELRLKLDPEIKIELKR